MMVRPAGDLLEDRLLAVERVAALVDVRELHRRRRSVERRRRRGFSCAAIIRNSVVLPAPLGPITPTMPPRRQRERESSISRRSP